MSLIIGTTIRHVLLPYAQDFFLGTVFLEIYR